MENIKRTTFTELTGSSFEVCDASPAPLQLTLTEVVEHRTTEHNEVFSLFFRGPKEVFLPQGTRRLRHSQLGEVEIFLVPVAQKNDGFDYEAVFNYILD